MCACTETDVREISNTTALSLARKGTVVAEKRSIRSMLLSGFLYDWTPFTSRKNDSPTLIPKVTVMKIPFPRKVILAQWVYISIETQNKNVL
jgi:hypothetical protein